MSPRQCLVDSSKVPRPAAAKGEKGLVEDVKPEKLLLVFHHPLDLRRTSRDTDSPYDIQWCCRGAGNLESWQKVLVLSHSSVQPGESVDLLEVGFD